jgi:hypothetical protein
MTSGNALKPIEVINRSQSRINEKREEPNVERIAMIVKDWYQVLRAMEAEESILKPRTMSQEMFYKYGIKILPPDLFNVIDHEFFQYKYGLNILIVGNDSLGSHIHGIVNPGISACYDTLGFHAIGIGALHALQTIIAHRYKISYDMEEAIYIAYSAKRTAEVAPGVGRETDICLVIPDQIIDVGSKIITEMSKIHSKIRKPIEDQIKESSNLLKKFLEQRRETNENEKKKAGTNEKQDG